MRIQVEKRFELLMYACQRENMLKFIKKIFSSLLKIAAASRLEKSRRYPTNY